MVDRGDIAAKRFASAGCPFFALVTATGIWASIPGIVDV